MKAELLQVPALRQRLALAGDRVTINVIPQHPLTTPQPVPVSLKAPIYAGPVGSHLAVFDYDRERDRLLPMAVPGRDGAFPNYGVEDPRFHQLNAYAIAERALDLVEYELGRLLSWGFEANRLIVLPHAGYLANAFYEEDTHSLQFFSFRQVDGSIYHTALVHDVVAHETGHALLDAVRDRYTEGNHRETAALHEAVGDLSAVFAAFSHEVVRTRFLAMAGPDLRGPNLVSSIAENFRASAVGTLALRDLSHEVDPDVLRQTMDPHVLSLALSGAVWETLVRMYTANRKRLEPAPAFRLARNALQRMVVRALDYLPPADATFAEFATAMYRADRFANPADDMGYRKILARTFADRRLVSSPSALADESDATAAWPQLPPSWPRITPADAYVFLDQNRTRLALSTQARYRDFVVRDIQLTSRPPEHQAIDAVVMTYEYPVDIELDRPSATRPTGVWLPIWGGGTLVFDADGRLRHHVEKPVTRKRVKDAINFLRAVDAGPALALDAGADNRVLAGTMRSPYITVLTGDRVVVRANPSARCGSRSSRADEEALT